MKRGLIFGVLESCSLDIELVNGWYEVSGPSDTGFVSRLVLADTHFYSGIEISEAKVLKVVGQWQVSSPFSSCC